MPPTTSSSIILTGVAAKKLAGAVVTDLYDLAKTEAGVFLKKWKAATHLDTITRQIRQLRLVKTIWQVEKAVDLLTFYHPCRIQAGQRALVAHRLADFNFDGSIAIQGTVGQGKSIFLRYLASMEFCATRRIPVFVELRRLREGQTLVSLALQELTALGFDMTEHLFHFFAKKGRLLLLLDAFDEVKEHLRQDLLSEIERLIRQHEALRVVITSRPQSGVENSAFLRVFQLCSLQAREYEQVIRKMAHSQDTAEAIIAGVRKEEARIANLLTTPLMVALLVVRYRMDQSLPQNDAAFYDSLFPLLLQRHDKTKGGYLRPRKSKMGDVALEDVFGALCFITRKANESSFAKSHLQSYAREAMQVIRQEGDVEKILRDIIDITCLIISDGDEFRFIHKSVQEYHAALFIKKQPDESARAFYNAMRAKWNNWTEELRFLELIDRYRYFKEFYISEARDILMRIGVDGGASEVTYDQMCRLCSGDGVEFAKGMDQPGSVFITVAASGWPVSKLLMGEEGYVSALLREESCKEQVERACRRLCQGLLDECRAAEDYVKHVEERKAVFEF